MNRKTPLSGARPLIETEYCFVPAAADILRQLPGMTLYQSSRIVAVVCWVCAKASGQDPTGAITGVVTDPSGATVPRARVSVKHKQTGAESVSNYAPYRTLYVPRSSRRRL